MSTLTPAYQQSGEMSQPMNRARVMADEDGRELFATNECNVSESLPIGDGGRAIPAREQKT